VTVTSPPSIAQQTLLATCSWLKSRNLTAKTLPIDFRDPSGREMQIDPAQAVLAMPQQRAQKHTKEELEELKQTWGNRQTPAAAISRPTPAMVNELDALLGRKTGRLFLDIRRLPANAIAFYRPYHLEPMDRWGIYIFVDRLLRYADQVRFSIPFFPNVTYCHLFWPLDTSRVDEMRKARHQQREAAKKAKRS
jgi:hypothetical protein